ncbi:MAG: Asp23/Gls24 family envelope stress response protein [Turicibacter sp.]|nr:Asp23/Gls24 family envelope stress response protein [Turicibacter sp.]
MAVSKYYQISETSNAIGSTLIHTNVFRVIAHNATMEVEGVARMLDGVSQNIADSFNQKKHRHGVEVEFDENGLVIDVYVSLKAGHAINAVAEKIQSNIHQMVYHMTAVKPAEIYVHVVNIEF